ncbi:GDSL-type esterase/lipase family protein [Kutzneria albida]|uniref:SGNH hydrolase-type esterase domain-containing protein n=1 Tax=Kutzneria albida DSM 43870 TaxID=1449976 RepID=W5WAL3_9PSEU|nr:GDSL-type esterase/lipase family protein [Kutzneria albida]AHH97790.1 hypothetical protein KALB_4428 [Kutzneria albida DSM 43870]
MRDFLRRFGIVVILIPALGLLLLLSDNPFTTPPGPPATAERAIVALGDSTMSGEGAGDYTPITNGQADNWCHRSPAAMIDQITAPDVPHLINLACSGAGTDRITLNTTTKGVEPQQTRQLGEVAKRFRVTAVLVAIGANDDPQFGGLINQCVQAILHPSDPGCGKQVDPQWPGRVNAMVPKVVRALHDIRKVMSDSGYSVTAYTLVLQSYAAPVAPNVVRNLQNLNGCPFRSDDLHWVQDRAVPLLDAGMRSAAEQAGVRFLDLAKAGTGHEACSGSSEWFTRLTVNWNDFQDNARYNHALQSSFHPNAKGYTAFAGCMSKFLATDQKSAACVPDGKGGLRLG